MNWKTFANYPLLCHLVPIINFRKWSEIYGKWYEPMKRHQFGEWTMIIFMDLMFCYDQHFAHDIGKLWLAVGICKHLHFYYLLKSWFIFVCISGNRYFQCRAIMALDLTLFARFQFRSNNYFTLYPKTNNIRQPVLLCSIFYITKVHAINTEKEMTIQELYCLYCPQQVLDQIYLCNLLPRLFSLCVGNIQNFAWYSTLPEDKKI